MKKFSGQNLERVLKIWDENRYNLSLQSATRLAEELGFSFYFDWESCRTEEGYYRVKGSVEYCVQRSIIFNDYADVIWMETDAPDLLVAQKYSQGVHAIKPHAILSYNLSPSFNWDAHKMTDDDLENFIPNLASMGYAW